MYYLKEFIQIYVISNKCPNLTVKYSNIKKIALFMGKKKIDNIKFMEDKNQRNITFSKRKRGLLKKVIELSSLCGQNILMFIYDKTKSKIIEFRSD